MTAQPPSPPAAGAPLAERISDFPSWLSPMLVKELRQGLRTNLFVIAFLLLQAFMILCLIASLANPGSRQIDGLFWFLIISVMLIVQPLRGFNSLSSEHQLNTIDLIQLTRLDAWRITLGKWTALNAQGLLFVTGVMPYLVIRYFLGSVDFLGDLAILGAITLASALSTSATIGCSVFRHIALRGILLAALTFVSFAVYNLVAFTVFGGFGGFGGAANLQAGLLVAYTALYGIYFFLSFGASRLAPLAENHATAKRLVALGFAAGAQLFHFFGLSEGVLFATSLILACACVDALTEPLPILARVLAPFAHPAKRIFGIILAPGWMSGLFFTLFCWTLFLCGAGFVYQLNWISAGPFDGADEFVLALAFLNLFLFPVLLIQLFFPQHGSRQHTFGLYLFIQAGLAVASALILAIGSAMGSGKEWVYLLAPFPSVLITAQNSIELEAPGFFAISLGTLLACLFLPLARQREQTRAFFSAGRAKDPKEREPLTVDRPAP